MGVIIEYSPIASPVRHFAFRRCSADEVWRLCEGAWNQVTTSSDWPTLQNGDGGSEEKTESTFCDVEISWSPCTPTRTTLDPPQEETSLPRRDLSRDKSQFLNSSSSPVFDRNDPKAGTSTLWVEESPEDGEAGAPPSTLNVSPIFYKKKKSPLVTPRKRVKLSTGGRCSGKTHGDGPRPICRLRFSPTTVRGRLTRKSFRRPDRSAVTASFRPIGGCSFDEQPFRTQSQRRNDESAEAVEISCSFQSLSGMKLSATDRLPGGSRGESVVVLPEDVSPVFEPSPPARHVEEAVGETTGNISDFLSQVCPFNLADVSVEEYVSQRSLSDVTRPRPGYPAQSEESESKDELLNVTQTSGVAGFAVAAFDALASDGDEVASGDAQPESGARSSKQRFLKNGFARRCLDLLQVERSDANLRRYCQKGAVAPAYGHFIQLVVLQFSEYFGLRICRCCFQSNDEGKTIPMIIAYRPADFRAHFLDMGSILRVYLPFSTVPFNARSLSAVFPKFIEFLPQAVDRPSVS